MITNQWIQDVWQQPCADLDEREHSLVRSIMGPGDKVENFLQWLLGRIQKEETHAYVKSSVNSPSKPSGGGKCQGATGGRPDSELS